MCNDTFSLVMGVELDLYGKKKESTNEDILNAFIELKSIYAGNNNSRQLVANGNIFLFAGISATKNGDDYYSLINYLVIGQEIVVKGKTYKITSVEEYNEPFSKNKNWGVKLEFI